MSRKNRWKEEMPMDQQKRINKMVCSYVIKCLGENCWLPEECETNK
jgi:hypothetical protein